MYAYVLFCISDQRYLEEILSFSDLSRHLLPPHYVPYPDVYQAGDFILFAWHSRNDTHGVRQRVNPGVLSHPEKGSFFASGYAAEGLIDADVVPFDNPAFDQEKPTAGIFSILQPSASGLCLAESPGGVSSNTWISRDGKTAQCWSTQPPAVPTFYAKNRVGYCVVSNRPRLGYCASVLSSGYSLSDEYLPKYISSGFAFDGSTPYKGTVVVPPNKSIRLSAGAGEIVRYPIGNAIATPQETPLEEKSATLASLLRAACWPAEAVGSANLFLSGGKDSRALATALKGISKLSAFTIGSISSGEGLAAKHVASRLGCSFAIRNQPIISDALKAAANSNLSTDGLGINFAHRYNFREDLDFLQGLPSFHGHGHLLRGGFARTMTGDNDRLTNNLHAAFLSSFASEAANSTVRTHIEAWRETRKSDFRDGRDVLFYSNLDYRLGLFTAPATLDLTSRTFMVFPLLDERVSRFASSLAVFDRVSERVVFGAMQKLAKDLTELPLFGEIWRFDRNPELRDFPDSDHNFQQGFELRQPREVSKLSEINVHESAFTYDADKEYVQPSSMVASEFILSSSKAEQLKALVEPYVWTEIESLATTGKNTSNHAKLDANTRFNLDSFISRTFIAATLYDISW